MAATDITQFIVDADADDASGGAADAADAADVYAGRTYYGNAEPNGQTVVLGGAEIVVGGWAGYEATKRAARWEANLHDRGAEPRSHYGGRTYVSGQDAVESLVNARCRCGVVGGGKTEAANEKTIVDPLERSAERLATAITQFEVALAKDDTTIWTRLNISPDSPVAVSTISPEDIRFAIPESDVNALHRAAEDAGIFASAYAREDEQAQLRAPRPPGALPPMPRREIALRGKSAADVNKEIAALEKSSVPRAAAIEAYRGEVAAVFDTAARVLERAVDQ